MELTLLLEKLRMDHLDAQLDAVCEQAAAGELDYKSFLARALETEWQGRYRRGIEARLRQSRFPWVKTCLLYTSPSPRDRTRSRMPASA